MPHCRDTAGAKENTAVRKCFDEERRSESWRREAQKMNKGEMRGRDVRIQFEKIAHARESDIDTGRNWIL